MDRNVDIGSLPYPAHIRKDKHDKNYLRFLDMFKNLHVNIPFTEALLNMPNYAKFMKEILSKKKKLEDVGVVQLTEKCSAIIQNKLPPKLSDPGSFTPPCELGENQVSNALCDLGASINLIPLSLCRKLNLGGIKETNIMLQMADRTMKKPS